MTSSFQCVSVEDKLCFCVWELHWSKTTKLSCRKRLLKCLCVCVFGIATLVGTFLGKTPLLGGQCYMWGHFFRYLLSDRVFWSSMFPWSNDKKYDPTRLKKSAEIIHTFPKVTFSLVKWFVVGTPCPCRDILQVPDRKEGFLRFDI